MSISTLVLTLNEEANLPRCLQSLWWCDDVVVLDSLSQDGTKKIAESGGCRVAERMFDNYANQRNFGLNQISYKHRWVLMLDADETVPAELMSEMHAAVASCPESVAMFRMRRKDMFMGRWIRRSSGYPTWFGRLVCPGRIKVERDVNEEYHADGEIRLLKEHLVHYPFNKGFHSWFEKHNRYSTMEAMIADRQVMANVEWRGLLCRDPQTRRKTLKQLVYRLPARSLLMFLGLYIVRGGFLEGRAGLTFCALRALYEFMIDCKVKELRLRKAGLPL